MIKVIAIIALALLLSGCAAEFVNNTRAAVDKGLVVAEGVADRAMVELAVEADRLDRSLCRFSVRAMITFAMKSAENADRIKENCGAQIDALNTILD